jgi:hypothetical protein
MSKVYIEFEQDDVFIMSEDTSDPDEQLIYEDESFVSEGSYFTPKAAYRQHIPHGLELNVDFDLENRHKLHLVVIHWFEAFGIGDQNPLYKWHIVEVCKTRREAVLTKYQIESGDFKDDDPWLEENCTIEDVKVYSLDLED